VYTKGGLFVVVVVVANRPAAVVVFSGSDEQNLLQSVLSLQFEQSKLFPITIKINNFFLTVLKTLAKLST